MVRHTGGMSAHRHLLVIRHAKAEAQGAADDHARPLSGRGRRDAAELGRWVDEQVGHVDRALLSSAVRAVQTWELAAGAAGGRASVDVRPSLYLADPGRLLAAVRETPDDVRTLAVVGHEPTQSALTLGLADDASDEDAVQLLGEGFRTAGVALLEVDGSWSALMPMGARLVAFAVPRALSRRPS